MSKQKKSKPTDGLLSEIDVPYMQEMVSTYSKEIQPVISALRGVNRPSSGSTPDAQSAWVSFEELKDFIAKNEVPAVGASGMRIFYGIHTRPCTPVGGVNQFGYHNMMLIPTISDEKIPTYKNSRNAVPVVDKNSLAFRAGCVALVAGVGKRVVVEKLSSEKLKPGSVNDSFPLCPPNCA